MKNLIKITLIVALSLVSLNADVVRNGAVTTDTDTNLMWEDSHEFTTPGARMKWDKAIDKCNNLKLSGHSDWRLPNIKELESMYVRTNNNASPVLKGFLSRPTCIGVALSSTPYQEVVRKIKDRKFYYELNKDTGKVYRIHLSNGSIASFSKGSSGFARCVRDAN